MAAGNRSPLGFGIILLFHLCILAVGVLLQNLHDLLSPAGFLFTTRVFVGLSLGLAIAFPRFLWDVFRSLKSAATLLTLLVLACIAGTLLIQELDLRRASVFDPGVAQEGEELPPFDDRNQSTRFALAEAHALLWIWPTDERERLLEKKVKLSPFEKQHVALRTRSFGDRAGKAFEEAMLASKRRQVEQLTTSNYAKRNQKLFYKLWLFTKRIHLFDIFEAWWFYFLLFLIAINVIVGTLVRAPWKARDWGVAITHSGILIILAGGFLDLLVAKEGYIYFKYGRPEERIKSSIRDEKNQAVTHLPFRVYLERFATEYYHELLVERYDWNLRHDGRPWGDQEGPRHNHRPFSVGATFPVRTGVPRVYEKGAVKVTVTDYKPRVFVRTTVTENEGGEPNPAVKLGLYSGAEGTRNFFVQGNTEPWLYAFDARRYGIDMYDSRFEYIWAKSGAEYRRLLRTSPIPDNGTLILQLGDDVLKEPVRLGQQTVLELAGRKLAIEFLAIRSALADESNVNLDRRLQTSEEPILYLRVNGDALPVPRDDSHFTEGFAILEGLRCRFDWPNPQDSGVANIFRVVEGEGLPPVLIQADERGAAAPTPMRRGERIPLIGLRGGFLALENRVMRAVEAREIKEVSDDEFLAEGGGSEDHLLAAWGRVEIDGPWGKIETELTPFDAPIFYGPRDGRPMYAFALVRTQQQRDWFSVLSVLDHEGNKVKTHPVQVNSPLRYGGYRFFQATAATDRDGLGISGISVTSNPGVNFMYVGYTVLTLGVCYIFFVRPILDRRRRRRRQPEAAA